MISQVGSVQRKSDRRPLTGETVEILLRFLIGGSVVSIFSILGDLFKPKSFAGVFAAAPTIALATMVLTLHKHGAQYLAIDARSMIGGAVAFCGYACAFSFVLMHSKLRLSVQPHCFCRYGSSLPRFAGYCGCRGRRWDGSRLKPRHSLARTGKSMSLVFCLEALSLYLHP